jgi:NAD kinase
VEKLYELGFLSSFEEDEAEQKLDVVFYCQSDQRRYCVS